ncbi:hypothetical protein C3Y87_14520 [Carbonactinospora thermoautotrophica]|uniref:hypothetical protein n=1 Tax=Carbonactinospora thermoautotrophica TaxID=1469144 RepID=UPI00226EB848|nr:hypothetical protein [Carbonactinospora thermoautotrophica]MCX9192606.1 hypothetical protein [Carbonactinospora thermoautotrophica]
MTGKKRVLIAALTSGAVVAAIGGGVYLHRQFVFREQCVVRTADGEEVTLEPDQAANAATIAAVGIRRRLPERAVTIALATAMQESKLRNLLYGDRDSVGLFQQRPSQGWGTREEILDPVYAADAFYDALLQIPRYQRLPLTEAAQRVQRSATPYAYAKHEPAAAALAGALTGRNQQGLTCQLKRGEYRREEMGANGLTPRADTVRRMLLREFGRLSLGGYQPGGVHKGHIAGSAHYEGRAIDVMFRPVNPTQKRRGWAVAQWAVAHAEQLGIATVIYDQKIWTIARSKEGWRDYRHPDGPTDDPTLLHSDHVHIDVVRGE